MLDSTPPETAESKGIGNSLDDMHSSVDSSKHEEKRRKKETAGKLLDSDGFELATMEAEDFENLTLEEKILCGYFSAKFSDKDTHPSAPLKMPILPKGS